MVISTAPKPEDVRALREMGFDEKVVIEALKKCDNNRERATEWILTHSNDVSMQVVPYGPQPESVVRSDDDELKRAIAMSMEESQPSSRLKEIRDPSMPLGLKNIGNIPYFTSLIQLLHSTPAFKKPVLDAVSTSHEEDPHKRKLFKFLQELKNIFKMMDSSEKKFEDSNSLFAAYTDIDGPYQIDNQKNDVADYLLKIVARVEEGLKYCQQGNDNIPNRKDSINFLTESPLIFDVFHGKNVNITKFKEPGTKTISKSGPENSFGKFELDAEHLDLYEAWGKAVSKKIENFYTGENTVIAKQVTWITELPKLLVFDIKRHQEAKNKKIFNFPEKIHPGRFLVENHGESYKLQKSLRTNKRKVKNLKISIEKFEKFNESELDISKMLGLCTDFLSGLVNGTDLLDGSEFESELLSEDQQKSLKSTLNIVEAYSNEVNSKLEKMKSDLESYSSQIEKAFNTEKFNSHEFSLTAVIVHDGDVGSGQFYSYMCREGKWWKYQDISISEVNFKEVLFHSLGEYGISAACCLVYSQIVKL
jgi:ubiquitin carboxyl-terminal hydrolase 25/28